MHHPFLYISLPFLYDYDAKRCNFAFYGERKEAKKANSQQACVEAAVISVSKCTRALTCLIHSSLALEGGSIKEVNVRCSGFCQALHRETTACKQVSGVPAMSTYFCS